MAQRHRRAARIGRNGLLRALIDRHLHALEPPRRALFAESDSLVGDVRALVLPVTAALAELPQPSWRARFFNQATHDPATTQLLRESADQAPAAARIFSSIIGRIQALETVEHDVVVGRASLMTHLIGTACAEIERRGHTEGRPPAWADAGRFLSDAIAGMLTAPVTAPVTEPVTAPVTAH